MQKRCEAAFPLSWGVVRQQFDISQLGAGIFRILALEAFFPDGCYIQYSSPHPRPLELNLDPLKETPDIWQTVWAILPFSSLKSPEDTESQRYLQQEVVLNNSTTEEPTPIPVLVPNLDLFLGSPPAHCAAVPLAKVSFRAEGFLLSPYQPPQLSIKQKTPIFELINNLICSLRNLANALILRKEEKSYDESDHIQSLFLLPGLIGQLPMLETLLFSESVHPLFLFGALANVGGLLSSVGHLAIPRRIDYDHLDPLQCFSELARMIQDEIARTIPTHHREVPFHFDREMNRFFLPSHKVPKDAQILVGVDLRSGMDEEKITRWMEEAIIGFENEIETFSVRRTVGAARQRQRGSSGLILYRRMQIWSLSLSQECAENESLCIHGIAETDKASRPVAIYLLLPEKETGFREAREEGEI